MLSPINLLSEWGLFFIDQFTLHPYVYGTISLLSFYLTCVTLYMFVNGRIEPSYKRKIPTTLSELWKELIIELETAKNVLFTAFGYTPVYIFMAVLVGIPLMAFIAFFVLMAIFSNFITPTFVMLFLIWLKI